MAAEITKEAENAGRPIGGMTVILFTLLSTFTYFFGLTIPLLGPDEPRYAQVAREMFERGDWITPTLGGFPWFEKPALLYWLEIASYKILGISEFSARFGPAIFGLGIVFCLWLLAKRLGKQELAKWLVLVGASTIGIVVFARAASFDIILTFPMTASLVAFFLAEGSGDTSIRKHYLPLASFYAFIGIALIAKGLVGIVFPFAIVTFYFLLQRRIPRISVIASLAWGTLLAVAVACIWYVPVYLANGYHFIDEFFVQHHFQRYLSNKYQHPQPFYFFLWVLPLMTIPWLPFFLAALWNFGRSLPARVRGSDADEPIRRLRVFCIAWLLVPLVFFSFSGSKLPGYILPAVPPAIILAAEYITRLVSARRRWRTPLITVSFITLFAVCLMLQFAVPKFADEDSVKALIAKADLATGGGESIFGFHTISHNAEFYGAGRVIRMSDGQLRRFTTAAEIVEEMKLLGFQRALILMPIAYQREMPAYESMFASRIIGDNGKLAIVEFTLK